MHEDPLLPAAAFAFGERGAHLSYSILPSLLLKRVRIRLRKADHCSQLFFSEIISSKMSTKIHLLNLS